MVHRKSLPEPELISPIPFRLPSNGEFAPLPPKRRALRAEALWRRLVEDKHRRVGLTRREFAESACGVASALWAINQVACSDSGAGGSPYAVDEAMTEDEERARVALSGDEFIFDVQTHAEQPLTPFDEKDPPTRALDFVKQIFVQSDTTVACISGVPATRDLGRGNVAARTLLAEIIDRLAGPRLVLHANADPENGAAELDYMAELAGAFPVAAWKVYPHVGELRLDSEELGLPFVERAQALGVPVIAAHRGISNGGGYERPGSPRDAVRAARAAPGVRFLVYHSGWESSHDENHPYDPENPDPQGVDRLIRALVENGVGPSGNVYAELGTTWFNVMTEPEQAAHVLGKLLVHLGAERIVWGTDSVFNGVPQAQITAFRTFQIPEAMQERFGYPALTAQMRQRIFGMNAAEVYGVDPSLVRFAIANDDVDRLRSAYLQEPESVPMPGPHEYTGPRTRREFFAWLARERREGQAGLLTRGRG